ncbi:MAG: two-component system, OmpR family, phosphate regulon sensor histidine kinase PhoR [Chloroflexota bacterium]|jgi:signal transduction histidine kinase|nr:two-component system, OmpR family, phosphate regulon sensor histidine kinase PhoR [Chloroflexota bacterium]MEA2605868.1 two-component system, OmpR family, phosphate regulon sensor histidine kinase PhoR [Chloroflexota bacterium]
MFDREPSPRDLPVSVSGGHSGPSFVNGTAVPRPVSSRRSAGRLSRPTDLGRVRAVIDALPEAVIVTEAGGDLRLTNPAADRLFANRPIVDRSDLLARFEPIDPSPGRGARAAGPYGEAPVTVRPRGQPNRWFTLRSVPLDATTSFDDPLLGLHPAEPDEPDESEGQPGDTVFVLRDVTDSRDLRPVREAFIEVMSHELRTPITTIYAGSSVLARRPRLSASATQTLAGNINAEAARLYDLVEDLLVLARLERRVLDLLDEPVLVQRAVDSTIRMIVDRLGAVPIERRGGIDLPPVHGDATYVEQACRNLILASIRFAGPEADRQLIVDVRSDPAAGEVTISVLDRGPSLARSELDGAFELPNAAAVGRLAGSGVGPFVCRHLVEAMGGRVWSRNRSDGGLESGFALRIDERV